MRFHEKKNHLTLTGLTLSRYGQNALRLPEAILEASNQNRYCFSHHALSPEPLSSLLCFLDLSLGGIKVAKFQLDTRKQGLRLPEAILEARQPKHILFLKPSSII